MELYHNARCAKSRAAHQLLTEQNIDFKTIEYLKTPLTEQALSELLVKLDIPAHTLVRKGEAIYKEKFKGKELTEQQWIEAMIQYPKLIERPIFVKGDQAVIGRPINNVIDLLDA